MNNPKLIAEFFGTFALVFFGAGSAAIGYGGLTGIALTHGLILMINICFFAAISGAHFNPAITIALCLNNNLERSVAIKYVLSQLSASLCAAALLALILKGNTADYGSTHIAGSISDPQAFLLEAVMTFFLAFAVLRSSKISSLPTAAALIGFTLTAAILVAGPLTGASLNPARSLGPCIFSGSLSCLWLYFTAPIVGAWSATIVEGWLSSQID